MLITAYLPMWVCPMYSWSYRACLSVLQGPCVTVMAIRFVTKSVSLLLMSIVVT